jgi:hypothetical protein
LNAKLKGVSKAEFSAAVAGVAEELGEEDGFEELQEQAVNAIAGIRLMKAQNLLSAKTEPSILTWDLARAINLCRWGYDVQYLGKDEALAIIGECAAHLYKAYDSWSSLSAGYLLGFFFWSGEEDEFDSLVEGQGVLLSHEKSPWKTITW